MATLAVATAAGAAALLYYTGWAEGMSLPWPLNSSRRQKLLPSVDEDGEGEGEGEREETAEEKFVRLQRIQSQLRRPVRPPATWTEALSMLAEALRFTYAETLGKWPIHHLAFGINFLLRRQGQLLHVDEVFAGEGSERLRGPAVVTELEELLRLTTFCYLFSKRTITGFLEGSGFTEEDILLYEPRAALLKPAFAILLDHTYSQILVIIRGTHSMKDTLTVVTGAIVPFHHALVDTSGGHAGASQAGTHGSTAGGVQKLVLGYAHCGMVAAARCIALLAEPKLREGLERYPDYKIKIIGHSLGGGTAALLTFALREKVEFKNTTCTAVAPAACMTWELAESGVDCVTSVVHGADVVPTFSAASADDLRLEVSASKWVNDLREQLEQMRILRYVMQSANELQRRLVLLSAATNRLGGRGGAEPALLWRPMAGLGPKAMLQSMGLIVSLPRSLSFPGWDCMGPSRPSPFLHEKGEMDEETPSLENGETAEGVGSPHDSDLRHRMLGEGSAPDLMDLSPVTAMRMERGTDGAVPRHVDAEVRHIEEVRTKRSWSNQDWAAHSQTNLIARRTSGFARDEGKEWGVREVVEAAGPEEGRGDAEGEDGKRWREEEEARRHGIRGSCQERDDAAGLAALVRAMQKEGYDETDEGWEGMMNGGPGTPSREGGSGARQEYSWEDLEAELTKKLDGPAVRNEEEEAAALEITREEEEVMSHASSAEKESEDLDEFLRNPRRFFPCGRIIHLVRRTVDPDEDPAASTKEGEGSEKRNESEKGRENGDEDERGHERQEERGGETEEEGAERGQGRRIAEESGDDEEEEDEGEEQEDTKWRTGLFLTDRSCYGRVHMSRTMVVDHFMPNYKRAMQEVIDELNAEMEEERNQFGSGISPGRGRGSLIAPS
eukprot:TRINITY_DN91_c0_g2_i1.p1 TRINITY_DN91_c0_g2~~TRINITY_DN91_c0_g2_i1.p1  ORF type:complete len:897 (+),score=215.47 TRINITY_DN91_c0_g2_i1:1432-4122(+)